MNEPGNAARPVGKVEHYLSKMDGRQRPYAVCVVGEPAEPKPVIVEVSPGGTDLDRAVETVGNLAAIAAERGLSCVAVRPTGRGPGSVYQNYGEVDAFEAIEDAVRKFGGDRNRISVTGGSMGGAATFYLISHNPDFFSAGAPFCGYCDYRLWEKPGGLTLHMHEWEEPSWRARSAAFLVENFEHTPMWILHGEWDRSVGGGVPVEHSRQMARLLGKQGFNCKYTELPATGHGCKRPEMLKEVVPWLLQQEKVRNPGRVALATFELRHSRSYWVAIEQLETYGERGLVDARRESAQKFRVKTENVRAFSLGPLQDAASVSVTVDGQAFDSVNLSLRADFRRDSSGEWSPLELDLCREKHRGSSGPVGDMFYDNVILVPGALGTEEETFFLANVSRNAARYYRSRNGGVHRGGIMGENNVDLPIVSDAELSEEARKGNNLLLCGTYSTNSVLKLYEGRLPLKFQRRFIEICDRTFSGERAAAFAVFPHPENPDRCIAVHGGITPDAVTWGSHLDMHLLPDYIAYSGGELLGWGSWNNEWTSQ